jgi:hypothetical protein
MLPLHTFTRLGEQADADSPRSLDSFLARDVRDAEVSSMGFSATPDYQSFRPGNRLQIRIPIVQYPAPASKAAFHGKGRARRDYTHGSQQYPLPSTACSGLIARRDYTHLLDGDCFPREQTLASLPTASSDSTGDGVRGDMGVTK